MPSFQEFYNQNKVLVLGGAGVVLVGGALLLSNRSKSSSGQQVTLGTLHDDLQSIDQRLQAENSYLSSSASISPLTPNFDGGMAPGFNDTLTLNDNTTHTTNVNNRTIGGSNGGVPVATPPHIRNKKGAGPGDYANIFYGMQFNYPGDAADYAGLN